MGSKIKEIHPDVKKVSRLKGIYSKSFMKKGKTLTKENIFFRSPPLGLRDKELNLILGKKTIKNIFAEQPLKLEYFK